jgi:hypothetical protein
MNLHNIIYSKIQQIRMIGILKIKIYGKNRAATNWTRNPILLSKEEELRQINNLVLHNGLLNGEVKIKSDQY